MYITFDYQGMNFDALESLPFGTKEITKDLYINTTKKRLYFFVWGNANAYRYQYINMRVKSIDNVSFSYVNSGALSRISGMSIANIFYNEYRLIRHINGINFTYDGSGNLISYQKGVNYTDMQSGF